MSDKSKKLPPGMKLKSSGVSEDGQSLLLTFTINKRNPLFWLYLLFFRGYFIRILREYLRVLRERWPDLRITLVLFGRNIILKNWVKDD